MHVHMRKLGPEEADPGGDESGVHVKIERAYFATADGTALKDPPGLLWLFIGIDQVSQVEEDATHIHQSFAVPSPIPLSQLAHRVLPMMLRVRTGGEEVIPWHEVRQSGQLPMTGPALEQAARRAVELGAVRHVIRFAPADLPVFLGGQP
jgi:hypothetical protein